jgi:hypothetical protein
MSKITLKEFFLHEEEPAYKGFSQGMSFDDYFAEFSSAADTGGMPTADLEAAAKIAYRRGQRPDDAASEFMNRDAWSEADMDLPDPDDEPTGDMMVGKRLGPDFGRDEEPPPPPEPEPEPAIDDDEGSIIGEPSGDMDQFHLASDDYPEDDFGDEPADSSFAPVTPGRNNPRDIGTNYTQSTQFNDDEPRRAYEAAETQVSRNPSPKQAPGQGSPSFGRPGKVTPQDSITNEGDIIGGTGPSSWSEPCDKTMQLKDYIPEAVYQPGNPDYDYTFEEMQELAPKEMAELQADFPDQNEIMMGTFQVERRWDRDDLEGAKIYFIPATGEHAWQYDKDWGWSEQESIPGERPPPSEEPEDELTFDDEEGMDDLPADDIAREPGLSEPEDPAELGGDEGAPDVEVDDEGLPKTWWGPEDK